MKQAQPSTATLEAASMPAAGRKTATGVTDTLSEANLWQKRTFSAESQWGVPYSQSDPLAQAPPTKPPTLPFDHLFAYGASNPFRWLDPSGLEVEKDCECPCKSEEWDFSGGGWGAGLFVGKWWGDGDFKCRRNERLRFHVDITCTMKGLIATFGIDHVRSLGFLSNSFKPAARGCTEREVLDSLNASGSTGSSGLGSGKPWKFGVGFGHSKGDDDTSTWSGGLGGGGALGARWYCTYTKSMSF